MLQVPYPRSLSLARSPQQRIATIVIVSGLHVLAISAFLIGLRASFMTGPSMRDLQVHVPTAKPDLPLTPPRSDVTLVKPTGPTIPIPHWPEANDSKPPTGAAGDGNGIAIPEIPVVAASVAITNTHTTPDYPPLDIRLGHVGNVLLRLTIDENGEVANATVVRTSGYSSLDAAAVNWVIAHWRYRPAMRNSIPVASTADAIVTFRLTGH